MNYNDKACSVDEPSKTLMNSISILEDTANYSETMDKVIRELLNRINEPRKISKGQEPEKTNNSEELSFDVVDLVYNAQYRINNSLQSIERNIEQIKLRLF